jgi:hypothetical protein
MIQGKFVSLLIITGNAINGDIHLIIPVLGISGGIENADIGAHAAEHEAVDAKGTQSVLKRGAKKAAISPLRNNLPGIVRKLGDDLSLGRSCDAMWGEELELRVIGGVVIADKEDLPTFGYLTLQQALNMGDDVPSRATAIKGITILAETPEHIHHQNRRSHSLEL